MITDLFAHLGPWTRRPVGLEGEALKSRLAPFGVTRIYAGRTEALWFENPHDANRIAESMPAVEGGVNVPVLDPSLDDWRLELQNLTIRGPVAMIRLYPTYHSYTLADAAPALDELAKRKIIAQVVLRMDDPRRQHKLAQVPDLAPAAVREAAVKHPALRILMTGAQNPAVGPMAKQLADVPNLWADTAQIDGVDAIAGLMKTPWRDRLVFSTHAPLFIAEAGFLRVLTDIDDATAELILSRNAERLFATG